MNIQIKNPIILLLILLFPFSNLAAEVLYYDTDNMGSPVAMWDKNGNKVWDGEYYPFGEEFRVTDDHAQNKKRFIGKEKDSETGLTYFGARYMDEATGRFISPDPVRPVDAFTSKTNYTMLVNPQRLNRYTYGLNNPYLYVDLDGNFAIRAVYVPATGVYKFGATFHKAPKGVVGKTLGYIGKPVKILHTTVKKTVSAVGGKPVSYTRQGLGLKQAWSEASYDYAFQGMLLEKESSKLSNGFAHEDNMKAILQRFSGKAGYDKMNYPNPSDMIETAKENFDNSALGRIYKSKEQKK